MAKPRCNYQLHIQLQDTQPAVWRRVVVADLTTLAQLHRILATAMGWPIQRAYALDIAGQRYGLPCPDHPEDPTMDARRYTLAQLLQGQALPIRYVHDLHSDWCHRVRLEACVPHSMAAAPTPLCTAGRHACPPQGLPSAAAYTEFLAAHANRTHPGHGAAQRLHSGPWEPSAFDITAAQSRLQALPPAPPASPAIALRPRPRGEGQAARGNPGSQASPYSAHLAAKTAASQLTATA